MLSFNKKYYDSFAKTSYLFGILLNDILNKKFDYNSVIDFGCGSCDFIYGFTKNNQCNYLALDNHNEIIKSKYLSENKIYKKIDLTSNIDFNKKYDICFCLEVLEHIEDYKSVNVINNMIKHSDFIVFSSAHKGQGGLNHINEKDLDYWIQFFYKKNFNCYDFIRPLIQKDKTIPYYYKFNSVIFINNHNKKLTNIFNDYRVTKNRFKFSIYYSCRRFLINIINHKIVNIFVYIKFILKRLFI